MFNIQAWLSDNRPVIMRRKTQQSQFLYWEVKVRMLVCQNEHLWEALTEDKKEQMLKALKKERL